MDIGGFEVLQKVLEHIEEGVHVVDSSGRTVLYNKAAAQIDGLEVDEVMGKHILEVFPSLSESTSTLLQVIATGNAIYKRQQSFMNYKGRQITTVNTTIPLCKNGRVVGAVEISKNITEVRKMSEKIMDLQAELYSYGGPRDRLFEFSDIVTQDPVMLELKEVARRAARTSSSVLVWGETGTGKELFVQAIHTASARRNGPFVAQNCAAVPETLLEGILFGTVRGAFTGASDRPGLFELAEKGTLYLDEVNSMPIATQAKLLRAVQEKKIRRLGHSHERPVDVRIVASTNIDPRLAVEQRLLREDLYYRLNVISIAIPPLRQRKGDIPLLVHHFIRKWNARLGCSFEGVSPDVLELFMEYDWPGNVRQLENAIEAAMGIGEGPVIKLEHLPHTLVHAIFTSRGESKRVYPMGAVAGSSAAGFTRPSGATSGAASAGKNAPGNDENSAQAGGEWGETAADGIRGADRGAKPGEKLREKLQDLEKQIVLRTFEECGFNISRTARLLGLPRQTLQYRLKKLGVSRPNDASNARPDAPQDAP